MLLLEWKQIGPYDEFRHWHLHILRLKYVKLLSFPFCFLSNEAWGPQIHRTLFGSEFHMDVLGYKYLVLSHHSENWSDYLVSVVLSTLFIILLTYQTYEILHKLFFFFCICCIISWFNYFVGSLPGLATDEEKAAYSIKRSHRMFFNSGILTPVSFGSMSVMFTR